MNKVSIKICGLTREEDVVTCMALGVDALGFVLYRHSARYVTPEKAAQLARLLPPFMTPVLLFVNAGWDEVLQAAQLVPGAVLQFHGNECGAFCREVAAATGRRWFKAAHIADDSLFDFVQFGQEFQGASAWLLDTHSAGFGGSGRIFDWEKLPDQLPAHLILAGGLTVDNVVCGISAVSGRGWSLALDVSSGVEEDELGGGSQKGIKNRKKIAQLIKRVRAV